MYSLCVSDDDYDDDGGMVVGDGEGVDRTLEGLHTDMKQFVMTSFQGVEPMGEERSYAYGSVHVCTDTDSQQCVHMYVLPVYTASMWTHAHVYLLPLALDESALVTRNYEDLVRTYVVCMFYFCVHMLSIHRTYIMCVR